MESQKCQQSMGENTNSVGYSLKKEESGGESDADKEKAPM